MAGAENSPVDHAHELNRRIKENPGQKLQVIQRFYSEMVQAGDRGTAELVLVIRSMMDDDNKVPAWFQRAGFVTDACVLFFLMVLVVASVLGHEIPNGSKFLVVAVFAQGVHSPPLFWGEMLWHRARFRFLETHIHF